MVDAVSEMLNPDEEGELQDARGGVAVIACGALAREILDIIALNSLDHVKVTCLPAKLHNRPDQIPERLTRKIRELRMDFSRILVAYADCGTGGLIDKVVASESTDHCRVERMAGPHCYAFFAGQDRFEALAEPEPGTFYLTDYLARHFETLIIKGMGLDRYPEMRDLMFGNYTRVVYLAQIDDPALTVMAEKAAEYLNLRFERMQTGYGELESFMRQAETTAQGQE